MPVTPPYRFLRAPRDASRGFGVTPPAGLTLPGGRTLGGGPVTSTVLPGGRALNFANTGMATMPGGVTMPLGQAQSSFRNLMAYYSQQDPWGMNYGWMGQPTMSNAQQNWAADFNYAPPAGLGRPNWTGDHWEGTPGVNAQGMTPQEQSLYDQMTAGTYTPPVVSAGLRH